MENTNRRPLMRTRMPSPLLRAVDELAVATGTTRAECVRSLLTARLAALELWPPQRTSDAD